ncbi:hypothetical protein [Bacillus sp. Marseille-P3661]|uniref:hypothetical protein n=1 Tax=Bacillus sp. Marseille-P3661 TaxID=1936234 RepID=UPI000C81F45D|nr:hypothetical protein [Bacillus sp. Marseille-P3661]
MLSTDITTFKPLDQIDLSSKNIHKSDKKYSILDDKTQKTIGSITMDHEDSKIKFEYGGNLTMDQYEIIHNSILYVNELVEGKIDDSNSLLGYLENGEGAYVVTNWNEWYTFLHKAKFKTMEGQKVKVLDEDGVEIGTGLLMDYKLASDSSDSFIVTECTLITTDGEETFSTTTGFKVIAAKDW